MSLKQLTVFVENKQGAIVDITDALAKNNVDLRALSIADTKDFRLVTRKVNGGYNGMADRQKWYDRALKVLS